MPLGSQREIRILHVDDEPSLTDLTKTFLEREDDRFTVETATNADDGREIIEDRPPDCVVSDYNMPGMDGLEFLQAVREEHPDLPFILYTGKGSEAVASEAIACDVTDYLQKGSGSEQYELLANRIRNSVQARREAQRADRQEQLMRLTEFAGNTGGFELDTDAGAVEMTDGARRMLNVPEQAEFMLEEGLESFHPDDRENIQQTIQRALQTGEQTRGTWRYRHPDGDERLLDITYTPVTTNGETTTIRGAVHDITDRRERQRELKLLQQAIDDANVPITLADPSQPDEPLVYVNDAFEELTGYSSEEALGRNCRYLQGEDTDPERTTALREAIDDEEPITVELRNYRKDGTEFWNRLTVTPIYDDDGQLVRYLGTQEDVTERKERERELEKERRFIQQSLDTLDDLFYVLNPDGTLRRWNSRVLELTGYSDQALAGMEAIELFPEDERKTIADAIETTLSDGRATVEADLRTAGGERLPCEFAGTHLTDDNGSVTGLVGIGRDLTERRQRERRFQALVEESNDLISVIDSDGVFQYQSPSIEHVLGYGPEETIGDTAWEYVHPDDRTDLLEAFERGVANPESTPVVEFRARRADGSWCWLEAHGNNQLDNPAVEGYIINSRDITKRKRRQRELERQNDLFAKAQDIADVGAWAHDVESGALSWTDEVYEMHGVPKEFDPSLDDVLQLYHPDDQPRLREAVDQAVTEGTPYDLEVRMTAKDDGTRWLRTVADPHVENGEVVRVRGTVHDITERKQREQEIMKLKRQYQTLSENFPDGAVYLIDRDLEYVRARGAELRRVGLSPATIEGKTPHDLFPEAIADELRQYYEHALDGTANTFEQEFGGQRYRIQTVPVRYEGEAVTHLMAVARNITEYAEDRRELERKNERLQEFASIVSHDLQNPLNVAKLQLDLAQDASESEHLEKASAAIERGQTLIEDLLTLAREGDQVEETEAVDLAEVAQNSWQTTETRQATLETSGLRVIEADPTRLRQLFENLYRNSVEHGDDDVTVSVGVTDNGFYVADTGPGIPETDGEEVFEAGYSTTQDGTGFGLRIVEEVAEAHGWEISVTDSNAGGARFEVTGVEVLDC